jgi:hypothetical protein
MPEKEKSPQGVRPIRDNDAFNLSQTGYIGNIPPAAVRELENEAAGLMHGTATLTLHIKDGIMVRFTTNRERSFVPGKPMTGSGQ